MSASPNRFCPQCGTQLAPNTRFCGACGSSVSEPSSLAPTQYGSSPASVPPTQYADPSSSYDSPPYSNPYSSSPYGSSGQSYAPPPPPVGVPYAAPPSAGQKAVGARTRPTGVIFLLVLVGLQAVDDIISFFVDLRTGNVIGLVAVGILAVATIILVWGLWALRRWAFVTAIVLEIVYLLFTFNLALPANLVTIIERVILEIVIPLTVLICLFAVRNVRAAFRGK
jgi:zinc-ribbon domain